MARENRELHRLRAENAELRAKADTWELAAMAAISEGLDRATRERVGLRIRAIVGDTPEAAAVPDVVSATAVLPVGGAVEPRTGRDRPHAGS